MTQDEIAREIKNRVVGLKDIAVQADVSYPYLTQIVENKIIAGPRVLAKLEKYLNNGRSKF